MSSSEEKSRSENEEDQSEDEDKSEKGSGDENKNSEEEEANKSESEENSQANKSNESAEDSEKEKKNKSKSLEKTKDRFDQTKLVLANEIKIDVVGKNSSEDFFMTNMNQSSNFNLNLKPKTSLSLLNEINSNLDELFEDLSRTIRTFNRGDSRREIENNKIPTQNQNGYLHSSKYKNSPSPTKNNIENEGYNSGQSEKFSPPNKKFFTDKETNTPKMMQSRGNNPMTGQSKEISPGQNRESYQKYTPSNPYKVQTARTPNNHMRTVEDLYRHNKSQPIIYSSNPVIRKEVVNNKINNNQMSKKYFEGEPEASNNGK
jgi:hypothetical protein